MYIHIYVQRIITFVAYNMRNLLLLYDRKHNKVFKFDGASAVIFGFMETTCLIYPCLINPYRLNIMVRIQTLFILPLKSAKQGISK